MNRLGELVSIRNSNNFSLEKRVFVYVHIVYTHHMGCVCGICAVCVVYVQCVL